MNLRHRRWRNLALAAIVAAAIVYVLRLREQALHHSSFHSGWLLLAMVLFLAMYNLRKKLTFLPLGSSAAWLQWHIYVGLVSIVVFLAHIGPRVPNGVLETALALLFIIVAGSGLLGLAATRLLPPLLSVRGEEVIFERIPAFALRLRQQANALASDSLAAGDTTALADYYRHKIASFFDGPRHYWFHLFQSSRPRHALMDEIASWTRYLNEADRKRAAELADLVCAKDDLDYHHALQKTLKTWLFVHIGLTYAMILLAIVHAVMAHVFHGGLR
jgi:hypothetical protein